MGATMKRILITAIILLAWAPAWAGSTTVVVGQGSAAPAGGSCDLSSTMKQETDADYWSGASAQAQKVSNASSITICKVGFRIDRNGADVTYHVELWSAGTGNAGAQMTGDSSQLGGDSPQFTTNQTGAYWYEVTWTSNKPNPTGDYFIHLVPDSSGTTTNQIRTGANATAYSTTDYDLWRGQPGEISDWNYDACFRVYTE